MTNKIKFYAATAAMFLALSFALERPAYAYVDPGSSLLIFQSLSAIVTGTLFYFRRRIKSIFSRSLPSEQESSKEQI